MLKTVLVIASKKKLPSSKKSKYPKQISYKMTALVLMQTPLSLLCSLEVKGKLKECVGYCNQIPSLQVKS